jgi:hypothetical protein
MKAKLRTFLEAPHHRALPGAWLSGIDEMFHRGQITDRQHTAAIMFIRRPDYRGPLRLPTERILMRGCRADATANRRKSNAHLASDRHRLEENARGAGNLGSQVVAWPPVASRMEAAYERAKRSHEAHLPRLRDSDARIVEDLKTSGVSITSLGATAWTRCSRTLTCWSPDMESRSRPIVDEAQRQSTTLLDRGL